MLFNIETGKYTMTQRLINQIFSTPKFNFFIYNNIFIIFSLFRNEQIITTKNANGINDFHQTIKKLINLFQNMNSSILNKTLMVSTSYPVDVLQGR